MCLCIIDMTSWKYVRAWGLGNVLFVMYAFLGVWDIVRLI
jgi:hypothetical protein